jgi:hypothetical protein
MIRYLFAALLVSVALQSSNFIKERLRAPGAVCLDGTEADFYIS